MWHSIQVVGHYRGFRSATSTRFNLKITFAGVDVLFLDNYPDIVCCYFRRFFILENGDENSPRTPDCSSDCS